MTELDIFDSGGDKVLREYGKLSLIPTCLYIINTNEIIILNYSIDIMLYLNLSIFFAATVKFFQ